jgi:hypothetical protein
MIPKHELIQKCTLATLKKVVGDLEKRPSGISKWKVEDYRLFAAENIPFDIIEKAENEQTQNKKTRSLERKKHRLLSDGFENQETEEEEQQDLDNVPILTATLFASPVSSSVPDEVHHALSVQANQAICVRSMIERRIETGSRVVWYTNEGKPRFGIVERLHKTCAKVTDVECPVSDSTTTYALPGGLKAILAEPNWETEQMVWNRYESVDCSIITLFDANKKYWYITAATEK